MKLVRLAGLAMSALAAQDQEPLFVFQGKHSTNARATTSSFPEFPSAKQFLDHTNAWMDSIEKELGEASWSYATNITDENAEQEARMNVKYAEMVEVIVQQARRYQGANQDEARQLKLISLMSDSPKDAAKKRRISQLESSMVKIYSTAQVDGKSLEPELTEIMATSRNYSELLETYIGWRNATGPKIKKLYPEFIDLLNQGARDAGMNDAGELWRSGYDMGPAEFTEMMENVWNELVCLLTRPSYPQLPLYEQIHCYTKYKLAKVYPEVDAEHEFIPAHLLGNPWSQDWSNIYADILIPFPDTPAVEMTPELIRQNYTVERMHRLGESFYTSLGYDALPESFWSKSMLSKPKDREVVCHARYLLTAHAFTRSAWDFGHDDLRIKMCTAINGEDLLTIHHEQGHLYYDHYYRDQPAVYRVVVPRHLREIGLLKGKVENSYKQVINAQMSVALSKIAILPWTYMIDLYRWKIMSGKVKPEDYQREWEHLMKKYQGIERPFPSSPDDFDAGSKYHVPANVPYVRYFGAAVIQFQFHEALCKDAGQSDPLYDCSIFSNKKAGDHFMELLKLGRSKPWQEAILKGTGGKFDTLSGKSIVKYFEPLIGYLKKENAGRKCGWSKKEDKSFS